MKAGAERFESMLSKSRESDAYKKEVTTMKEENRAQAEAFFRMTGDVLELIGKYAADFRQIILDYEAKYGKVPSADDLIWIESEKIGHDLTKEK